MDSMTSDASNNAEYSFKWDKVSIVGSNSIVGRSLVVHRKAPDTDDRQGCCVIGIYDDKNTVA